MSAETDDWPILVISLGIATERRAVIARQLASMNLTCQFIDAVDGRKGLGPEWDTAIDRQGAGARKGASGKNRGQANGWPRRIGLGLRHEID